MPGEVTTQEILRKAADVIRKNGWHQGDYYEWPDERDDKATHECKVCALGAIGVAAGCDLDELALGYDAVPAALALAEHLGVLPADEAIDIADLVKLVGAWNDADDRTASQVIAALLVAAGGEA